ncbi:sensor domain-containing diguanylate cyclase [Acidaminobacter sp. JC074]|uniref:diguanylate cyclase domain-containing protein n=1 Tax=Acidaminobacter sp. JC074 TaxID=2530199 RepID=UPI001F110915|nr:diguanylate cyclase [Acidaminobacter sp. JC074]MCH4887592.1 sensor domain-containing diguanylate cyclase [Acidaminobacter sp. JC074]
MNINQKNKGKILAILFGVLIFSVLLIIEILIYNSVMTEKRNNLAEKYIVIEDRVSGVIDTNFNILRGFSAYIQTTDELTGENIYTFLDLLFEGSNTFIRNIGIIEDTTIVWNYPYETNQAAIGVDLAEIPGQREDVLQVKNEGVTILTGPVDLVQGGNAYIIRMPIRRNDAYFGQISIVVDGDKFTGFLDETAEINKVSFMIKSNGRTIYDKNYAGHNDDMVFTLKNEIFKWTIYLQPEGGWALSNSWFILLPFVFLLVSILGSFKVFSIYIDNQTNIHNANHDPLTGLYNRHYLYKYAESIFNIAKINQYKIGIIVIDIDHFKKYNDTYGHKTGDEILINFSNKIKNDLRKGQEIFRIGGDEFIIILENINDLDLLEGIAERIKNSVKDYPIVASSNIRISISAGVAMYPDDGVDLDVLYNFADQNMYKDKEE